MLNNTFDFGLTNSAEWGIKIIKYEVFAPPLRDRSQFIPNAHGRYDYSNKKYYDPRAIMVECHVEGGKFVKDKTIPMKERREMAYWLKGKKQLKFWDEPYKHYNCQVFDSVTVDVMPQYIFQTFTLPFVCNDPFAHSEVVTLNLTNSAEDINYAGTVETPTLIVIKNESGIAVSNINVTMLKTKLAE